MLIIVKDGESLMTEQTISIKVKLQLKDTTNQAEMNELVNNSGLKSEAYSSLCQK